MKTACLERKQRQSRSGCRVKRGGLRVSGLGCVHMFFAAATAAVAVVTM